MEHNASDNSVDLKISNNKVVFYGNVTLIGSISVASVGFLFLFIWMRSYWEQAVTLSAIVVYGLVTTFFCVIVMLVASLLIRFVVCPGIDARERFAEVRARAMKDRVLWTQENAVVIELEEGQIEVIPLFPGAIAAPSKEETVLADDATVIELYKGGCTYETIMDKTKLKYHRVQRIISEAKKRGEVL